jgi:pimeloyl-ACP methyl ester carboxylesterase
MRTRPAFSPCSRALLIGALATGWLGCSPAGPGGGPGSGPTGGKADDGSEGPAIGELSTFHDDSRFTVRRRFDFTDARQLEMEQQPFSHRSERWHVFPFVSYGDALYTFKLNVDDPRMQDRAAVWIYGPRQDDGTWRPARKVETGDSGLAKVQVRTQTYGQYALIVGPSEQDGFLPRYPGDQATVSVGTVRRNRFEELGQGQGKLVRHSPGKVCLEQFSSLRLDDEQVEQLCILDPITDSDRDGEALGTERAFEVEADNGRRYWVEVDHWKRPQWLAPEDADGDDELVLGYLNDPQSGMLSIHDDEQEDHYHVMEAIGPAGSLIDLHQTKGTTDPAMLKVVPAFYNGQNIDLEQEENCDQDVSSCLKPVYLTEEEVQDDIVRAYRPTYIDLDENSTYMLSGTCDGMCAPEAKPTTYPIYFAHGFQSSRKTWVPLLSALSQRENWSDQIFVNDPRDEDDDGWIEASGWVYADNVPPLEPVENRAEQLRRNLEEFLGQLRADGFQPPNSEPFMRLNIVAHSMGGLDSRYLLGHDKYNNPQCHVEQRCTTAAGEPTACCMKDADGNAIEWRERVVSVTTLSTPHHGSSFADYSLEKLESGTVEWAFRKAAEYLYGLGTERQQDELIGTLEALSIDFAERTMEDFRAAQGDRRYDWSCATDDDCRAETMGAELPMRKTDFGRYMLPEPDGAPTLFSWGAKSCYTGTCGDTLDSALVLPYRVVQNREGTNDGVVSTRSARDAGIFMGIRANDHFRWTRLEGGDTIFSQARGWIADSLFGTEQEPMLQWHLHWLDRLERAGY